MLAVPERESRKRLLLIVRHSHAEFSSSLPCMIQADPALPGGLPYGKDRTASQCHSALM
jgi:hypothetical protein